MGLISTRGLGVVVSLAVCVPLLALTGAVPAAQAAATRPTDDLYVGPEATPVCRLDICVHHAQDGVNDVPAEDDGAGGAWKGYAANGVPDYVDLVSAALLPKVASVLDDAGYLPPAGDGALGGGDNQVDIYLAELSGVEGGAYCSKDASGGEPGPGFCVLDNDYSPADYGTRLSAAAHAGLDVAHQYFRLVQWAYLGYESWLNAASSSWLEDEIFPTLNRNRAYLPYGPMGRPAEGFGFAPGLPGVPAYQSEGLWIFLRYLSERYHAEQGGLPVIVRDIWEHSTDPGAAGPSGDEGLLQMNGALTSALVEHGTTLTNEFTRFSFSNRDPARFYDEGSAYRAAAPASTTTLTGPARAKVFTPTDLPTLSATTHRIRRGSGLPGAWRIKVVASLANELTTLDLSIVATLKVTGKAPAIKILDTDDHLAQGAITLPFSSSVEWVEITFVSGQVKAVTGTPWPLRPEARLRVAAVR